MGATRTHAAVAEHARQAVAQHLARFPDLWFSTRDLARVLGISNTSASKALARLAGQGLVTVTREPDPALGYRMATRYRATPSAPPAATAPGSPPATPYSPESPTAGVPGRGTGRNDLSPAKENTRD